MKRPHQIKGFSLVEVTLALGVASFSLLTIFALLPLGLRMQRASDEKTNAPKILALVGTDLRATPRLANTSPIFNIPIPATSGPGTTTLFFTAEAGYATSLASDSRYRLIVSFYPNTSGGNATTFASLRLTWPAAADPSRAEGAIESFVAFAH